MAQHTESKWQRRRRKLGQFSASVSSAVIAGLLLLFLASIYESCKVQNLYSDVGYRYFDAFNQLIDFESEPKGVKSTDEDKRFYFATLKSIAVDIGSIRHNQLFNIDSDTASQLAVLQTQLTKTIANRSYTMDTLVQFCKHWKDLLDVDCQNCSEKELILRNAKLICDANKPK